jgi:molybdate transport system substrate-binding protein
LATLALVADGEADAGFVYATDALTTPRVRLITRVDPHLHEPIEYPLLLLRGAGPEAMRFYDYLISEPGRAHFHDRGFLHAGR